MNREAGVGLHQAAALVTQAGESQRGFPRALVALESLNPKVESEWEELADATCASPFRRPGWIAAWWHAFGEGRLELATVRFGGRLTVVLPLRRRLGALTSPSNWHTPDFG